MTVLTFYLRQLLNRIWFLPAVFSAAAMLTIVIAFYIARWAPQDLPLTISEDAIQSVLQILATSLLTVSVFSLSTLVSALSAASAATSPRAIPLIVGDRAAQTSISVFIGAFLFSILAILGLSAGIYSSAGRMLLFSVTLGIVVVVIAALLRWIAHISDIGRVAYAINRVENATSNALAELCKHPLFDGRPLDGEAQGEPVHAEEIGYVQHFDAARLQELAEAEDLNIVITARPGTYVSAARPLMFIRGAVDKDLSSKLAGAFVVGRKRRFESDPRFGLVVLGEIADHALSAAVNDPGTAIEVIGTVARLLSGWQLEAGTEKGEVKHDRLRVAALAPNDLLEDAFRPVVRDGAGMIEVVLSLLSSLQAISQANPLFHTACIEMTQDAVERARQSLEASVDLRALDHADMIG